MLNLKKILSMSLVMAMAIGLFGACGGNSGSGGGDTSSNSGGSSTAVDPGEVIELSWAGIGATDGIDTILAENAAKEIEERTNGAVKITVYPASQLGDYVQAYEEIMQGTIDMGLFTLNSSYDAFMEAVYIPFLVNDMDDYKYWFSQDSFIVQEQAKVQEKYGIKLFGFWPSGLLGVGFTNLQESSKDKLYDFSVHKEDLVRAPALETMAIVIKDGMNFNTTTINYADLYTALQTGVADGWYGGGPYLNNTSFVDVINYFVDYKILPDSYACIMNQDKWNSIPAEYQDIINECLVNALDEGVDMLAVQEEEAIDELREAGVEVFIPTDEERNQMKDYMIDNIWPKLQEFYGEEYMTKLAELAKEYSGN